MKRGRKPNKGNELDLYDRWNFTTACCFKYKTKCVLCPNQLVCKDFKKENEIHPVKLATMLTYANIGKKGLERFKYDTGNEQA